MDRGCEGVRGKIDCEGEEVRKIPWQESRLAYEDSRILA